jgi:hypothetical protein
MKDIEQFLRDNAPETPAEGQFMIETNARLNAVEGIKKEVDGVHRRGRIALILALIAGLVIGCLLTLQVIFHPIQPATDSSLAKALETLQDKQEILFICIAILALSLGVVFMRKKEEVL